MQAAGILCAAAEALGIGRILFTSSAAVYGNTEAEADEDRPLRPFNEYGRSKFEAERVFSDWAERGRGRGLTIVRPTVVFGPGNRGNVHALLAQIARGRPIVIGGGHNRKSIAYVENVADFLVHVLDQDKGINVYNYADKPDLTMSELVALVAQELKGSARPLHIPYALALGLGGLCDLTARLTGRTFPVSAIRVRKYCANTQFAAGRVAGAGFRPQHSLEEALRRTIRHEFGQQVPRLGGPSLAGGAAG